MRDQIVTNQLLIKIIKMFLIYSIKTRCLQLKQKQFMWTDQSLEDEPTCGVKLWYTAIIKMKMTLESEASENLIG